MRGEITMSEFCDPVDQNGNKIEVGDTVLYEEAPVSLLRNLPAEDQEAIKFQAGKPMEILAFDQYGYVELEFFASDGAIHTIWIQPEFLYKIEP